MRFLRLVAVALGALGISSCFPDYEVAEGGSLDITARIPAADQLFAYQSNGSPFKARFSSDYRIDRFEVTVRRYQAWLDAKTPMPCKTGTCSLDPDGPYAGKMIWDSAWNSLAEQAHYRRTNTPYADCWSPQPYGELTTWELGQLDNLDLPMTCVSWFQAVAFCHWEGKRLPTEVEWVYAATSHGTNLKAFPWGDTPPNCELAIIKGCPFPVAAGSLWQGDTQDGVTDMVGSVFEWVWDAQWDTQYPQDDVDWVGPTPSGNLELTPRARHGGAYIDAANEPRLRNDTVEHYPAIEYYSDAGFRCAESD